MRLLLASLFLATVAAKQCPDPKFMCPDPTTCCKLEDGEWGCCPIQNAVCCFDHVHCCPSGSTCDEEGARCIQQLGVYSPLLKKTKAEKSKKESNDVICPDKKNRCPDDTTCCLLSIGSYGCCPAPSAVCCPDRLHCCPNGMNCDPHGQRCVNKEGWEAIPWLRKFAAEPIEIENEEEIEEVEDSADSKREEQDDMKQEADWRYLMNRIVKDKKSRLDEVICPDGRSKCPNGSTCCMTAAGKFGCCPAPHAVCCADHEHCCPEGSQCSGQRCIGTGGRFLAGLQKFPSTPLRRKPAVDVHDTHDRKEQDDELSSLRPISCGYERSCPSMATCCSVERNGRIHHMCCPLQNAVCCGETCCPHDFHCVAGGKCEKKARHYGNL